MSKGTLIFWPQKARFPWSLTAHTTEWWHNLTVFVHNWESSFSCGRLTRLVIFLIITSFIHSSTSLFTEKMRVRVDVMSCVRCFFDCIMGHVYVDVSRGSESILEMLRFPEHRVHNIMVVWIPTIHSIKHVLELIFINISITRFIQNVK